MVGYVLDVFLVVSRCVLSLVAHRALLPVRMFKHKMHYLKGVVGVRRVCDLYNSDVSRKGHFASSSMIERFNRATYLP